MPSERDEVTEPDEHRFVASCFLAAGFVFTVLWLGWSVVALVLAIWLGFVADPSVAAPDSLSRNSPLSEKVFFVALHSILVCFGIAWLLLTRYLWRRVKKSQ